MTRRAADIDLPELHPAAQWLGFAGLVPQAALAAIMIGGTPNLVSAAVRLALCYAALILSFIGGVWWGLAGQPGKRAGSWLWLAAVTPSLIAFAGLGAWIFGRAPVPGLTIIGIALVATLAIDARLAANGWCARGWLRLRTPLSLGLGGLSLLIAVLAP